MKCRLYSLFFALSLLSLTAAQAQTEVSGGIFDATTWTASNSPYVVVSDVVVFPDASLAIEPGTTVRVAPGARIELRSGSLFANGTEASPIVFTLDDANPNGTVFWHGIESTTPDNTPISIEVNHAVIEYAETGIEYNGFGYRFADNVTFRFNQRGAYDSGAGYEFLSFTNCTFHDNAIGAQGRTNFENCDFYDNEQACVDTYFFLNGSEGARIDNCSFTNNDICITFGDYFITSALISNSVFEGNGTVATAYRITANNSVFQSTENHAIFAGTGTVENCSFIDNGIGIIVTTNPYQDTIRSNNFTGNDVGLRLEGPGAFVQNNIICGNTIYGAEVVTSSTVDIRENCWCTPSEAEIRGLIFDAFDDVSSGIALFTPFITDCVSEPLVFPGDINANGIANAWDLLPIGMHYGATGSSADNPGSSWEGREVADWDGEMMNGLNLKFADADGNGVIDEADILPILANYNQTHNQSAITIPVHDDAQRIYELRLDTPGEVQANEPVSFGLELGNNTDPVPDFYGIAFSLTAAVEFFNPGTFSLSFQDSWLGTADELMTIVREFPEANRIEVAFVRKDGEPRSGQGNIANLNFVMSEDLIISIERGGSGIETDPQLSIGEIEAVDHAGLLLNLDFIPTDLVIVSTDDLLDPAFRVYPNPTNGTLNLSTQVPDLQSIELFNVQGQAVVSFPTATRRLEMGNLAAGLYYLRLITTTGEQVVQKVLLR
ncbi:MAG: T9SS type A sorting domain-containing protein [Bacteroidota bacterium]